MPNPMPHLKAVFVAVELERMRQHLAWGEQNHPDGTGRLARLGQATAAIAGVRLEAEARLQLLDSPTYAAILAEEVGEALREGDKAKLEVELIQCAAVIAQWLEKLIRERS